MEKWYNISMDDLRPKESVKLDRDPGVVLDAIREVHEYAHDLRVGQILRNVFGDEDIFYLENDAVARRIRDWLNDMKRQDASFVERVRGR
jgi:hypothetical protein